MLLHKLVESLHIYFLLIYNFAVSFCADWKYLLAIGHCSQRRFGFVCSKSGRNNCTLRCIILERCYCQCLSYKVFYVLVSHCQEPWVGQFVEQKASERALFVSNAQTFLIIKTISGRSKVQESCRYPNDLVTNTSIKSEIALVRYRKSKIIEYWQTKHLISFLGKNWHCYSGFGLMYFSLIGKIEWPTNICLKL